METSADRSGSTFSTASSQQYPHAFEEDKNEDDLIKREMATYRFVLQEMPQKPELRIQYYPEVEQLSLFDLYTQLQRSLPPGLTPQQQQQLLPQQHRIVTNSSSRLRNLRDSDQSNLYCIDCKSNLADHASLTYGIFICGECAEQQIEIMGPQGTFIKPLFKNSNLGNAQWDEYQLKFMERGGNYQFQQYI